MSGSDTSSSAAWLRPLAGRAAFLWERRDPKFEAIAGSPGQAKRIEEWERRVSGGERGLFDRYLAWEGLDRAAVTRIAGNVTLAEGAPAPEWLDVLGQWLDRWGRGELTGEVPDWRCGGTLPFAAIWGASAPALWEMLRARAGRSLALLDAAAQAQLLRMPLAALADLTDRIFYAEFDARRSFERSLDPFGGAGLYDKVVEDIIVRRLRPTLETYPVLARSMGTVISTWLDASTEFLRRLEEDRNAISAQFAGASGAIVSLKVGLSDRHRGGRFVAILEWAGGTRLVYKPKSLATEQLYSALIERLRGLGLTDAPDAPGVLERPGYGWAAYVAAGSCSDAEAITRFYRRAGVHLALFYLLGGSDLHFENVIAAGDNPVIVDLETLAHGRARYDIGGTVAAGTEAANAFFFDSVMRTGLLPRWEFDAHDRPFDMSGLGGGDGITASHTNHRRWRNANSDLMRPDTQPPASGGAPAPAPNKPRLDGAIIRFEDHQDDLIAGFDATYRLLERHRAELGAWPEVTRLRTASCRFIMRNTRLYAQLLIQSQAPLRLRDGFDASMPIESLSRALLMEDLSGQGDLHPLWSVFRAERRQMAELDIPVIETVGGSDALIMADGEKIAGALQQPPFERILANIARLSEADRQRQIAYIRASVAAMGGGAVADAAVAAVAAGEGGLALWGRAAEQTAREIVEAAFRGTTGDAWWLSIMYHDRAQRWQIQPMVARFYDGASGTALFLAAHAAVSGDEEARALATQTLNGFLAGIEQHDYRRGLFEAGIGIGLGAGSMAYALLHLSVLLDRPDALAGAGRILHEISGERIAADTRFDLLGGSAGAILAAWLLRDDYPDVAVRVVRAAADHLLASRIEAPGGARVWPGTGWQPLVGLTHGAGGIAVALRRAAELTGDLRYEEAAQEALAYERSTFDAARGGWPDFRLPKQGGQAVLQRNWCNGAAGIGLSRLMAGGEDAASLHDMDCALAFANGDAHIDHLDHICCGAAGRAILLREVGGARKRADLVRAGDAIMDQIAQAAGTSEGYRLGWPSGLSIPSFHQGSAGIGYALLRASRPDAGLPELTAFAPPAR